jgi:hypothetical protein
LASFLPKGDEDRRALLASLKEAKDSKGLKAVKAIFKEMRKRPKAKPDRYGGGVTLHTKDESAWNARHALKERGWKWEPQHPQARGRSQVYVSPDGSEIAIFDLEVSRGNSWVQVKPAA